ncbi:MULTISPECIES: glucans biosynthesis glucosyltransferase MdoH [unclassified Sphingomonas]|uniref:glucans biosynthesis glucosyltransferase MdoH n=1 Tax=unclassified Sphingomonas TaxID=196159 RepID=UPI00226A2FE9|nr:MULTISPECIES: glucans biosynthesis glucosyltransferase MdoH [unclassified Sphingomonas]
MTLPAQLPPEAPLAMPAQRFDGRPPPLAVPAAAWGAETAPGDILARRLLLVVLTGLLATAAAAAVEDSLLQDGLGGWDVFLLLLFFPLFGWIAFGFVNAAIGFVLLMTRLHPGFVPAPSRRTAHGSRTAVLVPVHNEDVDAVYGRVERMAQAIADAGAAQQFDFFILSDSGAAAGAAEEAAWATLAPRAAAPIYYRRRTDNVARKPGNIAEWIRRFGGAYDFMLMLDADSLMGGETMVGLAQVMEENPSVGLLQTVPSIIGGATLFQRWQQFASRLYGPISTAGLVWWAGSEATFWGHNALVRTRAFAEACGLPALSGPPPFGGAIMSHDMVEAALLRRRGWAVHMIMLDDSYEEYPPTLIDLAVRDRRWAQGNIQHLRLLGSSGFHWVSRMQLFIGASAFLTSPAWLVLIATGMIQALGGELNAVNSVTSMQVLEVTLLLLFGPKLLSVIWALSNAPVRRGFGGARAILRSVALEVPLSIIVAPAIALTQTIDLINIFRGAPSGWNPQNRDRDGLTLAEAMPRYRWHIVAGVVLLVLSPLVPVTGLWLTPVTLGLLLAPLMATWTASIATGTRYAARGYFEVPPVGLEQPAGSAIPSLPAAA